MRTLSTMQLTKETWRVQYSPGTFARTETITLAADEIELLKFVAIELSKAGLKEGVSLDTLDAEKSRQLIKLEQDGCPVYTISGLDNVLKLTQLGFTLVEQLLPFRVINTKCAYTSGLDYQLVENIEKLTVMFRLLQPGFNGYIDLSMKITDVASPVERAEFVEAAKTVMIGNMIRTPDTDGTVYMNGDVVFKYLSRHIFPQLLKLGIRFNR